MYKALESQRVVQNEHMRNGPGTVTVRHLWEPGSEIKAPQRLFSNMVLPPGAGIGAHTHVNEEEVYYVIRGTARVVEDGAVYTLNPGDTVLTQSGQTHEILNTGTSDLEIIAVITLYPEAETQL